MARKFAGESLDRAVHLANVMYHDGRSSVGSIARHLGCSWSTADRLIVYSCDKWSERKDIGGTLPLHFEDCVLAP